LGEEGRKSIILIEVSQATPSRPSVKGSVKVKTLGRVVVGRAVAQAVSRRLPTAAARVSDRAEHVEFVVDKVALGQVFSEYFGFPCQSSFHQFLHHHNHPRLAQ
jgi:hypothetical protein